MHEGSQDVTLPQVLENTFFALMSEINTCLPGRIESYDFKTQKCTVKPLIKKKFFNGDVLELPIITEVPVQFPRSKNAGMTFPLERGDLCIIIFCQRSMERWLASGEDVEPGDPRKFDLTDAIVIPGIFSFNFKNIANNNKDLEIQNRKGEVALGNDTSKTNINIDGLVTGKSINPFTGTPYGLLPGQNALGKNTSLKVRAEF